MSKITFEGAPIHENVDMVKNHIKHEMEGRAWRAAVVLRNSSQIILRGKRSGRRYKVPGTYARQKDPADGKKKNGRYYTASAPGEPPAVRTGTFRNSWQPSSLVENGRYISRIESDVTTDNGKYNLGEILEDGTSRMAPRPHHDRILQHAERSIVRIYDQSYFDGENL